MLEADLALRLSEDDRVRRIRTFLFFIQHLEGTLSAGQCGLQRVDHERCFCQRLGRLIDILEERLDDTDAHPAVDHLISGDDGDHHMRKPGQQTDQRVDAVGQEVCLL